ncbi:hypothetical protein ACTFIR_011397 [Dictyostelium discoideum]
MNNNNKNIDNENKHEYLFWKVFRNQFINFNIWSVLKRREVQTKRYKEIHQVEWIRKRYPMLLVDKIKRNDYLTFTLNDIKEILRDDNLIIKNDEQSFIHLRDHYKIDQLLIDFQINDPYNTSHQILDIIQLSIESNNLISLKVFSKQQQQQQEQEQRQQEQQKQTSYLNEALSNNNFEIIDYVYRVIGEKEYNSELIYQYLFEKPNLKVIEYAIDVIGVEIQPKKLPIWSLFSLPMNLINRIFKIQSSTMVDTTPWNEIVIQIEKPISSFKNFFYNFFQGTLDDLINHSMILLFIEKVYRKDQLLNSLNLLNLLNELSNLINQAKLQQQQEEKEEKEEKLLYYIDDSDIITNQLLKLYVKIILERCWCDDFYFLPSGEILESSNFSLIEYSVRYSDPTILERIDPNNKFIQKLMEKSCEYCNSTMFQWGINKYSKAKKFNFYLKTSDKIFKKQLLKLNINNNNNGLNDEIISFIDNSIINNLELISEGSLFQTLINLDNWEIFNYIYMKSTNNNNKYIIKSVTTMVLSIIKSKNLLENILKRNYIKKFFRCEKWGNPEQLLGRSRFDLVDSLDKFKQLDEYKANIDANNKMILNRFYQCDVVEYLIRNNYQFSISDILVDLVNNFNSQSSYSLSLAKFKLLLDLSGSNDEAYMGSSKNLSYGSGFAAIMIYGKVPAAISFIQDYRSFDIKSGKFKYNTNLLEMKVDKDLLFHFLLTSGKYPQLIEYVAKINSNSNMISYFGKIGKSGKLEPIKLYFKYLDQLNNNSNNNNNQNQNQINNLMPTAINTEIEPIPSTENNLYSILAGSIKNGHFEVVKLFEKYQPELFKKDRWDQFILNFNPFSNHKYKFLEYYINSKIINKEM